MSACCQQVERERRKRDQDALHECFPAGTMFWRCPVHAVEEFRRGDGSDTHLFGWPELLFQVSADLVHRSGHGQAANGSLQLDENGRV